MKPKNTRGNDVGKKEAMVKGVARESFEGKRDRGVLEITLIFYKLNGGFR